MNPKEEKFCQLRAFDTSLSQVDALLLAGLGDPDQHPKTLSVKAADYANRIHIRKRIMDLRDLRATEGIWSRRNSIDALIAIVGRCEKVMDASGKVIDTVRAADRDVIAAVKALNEMLGYDVPIAVEPNDPQALPPLTLADLYVQIQLGNDRTQAVGGEGDKPKGGDSGQ